ncbi:MAG: FAD binding domain-containing protein, partial [Gammaproteobacteria bacterium]
MYAFKYHRARNLAEASELYRSADDPVFVAGGHTLIPTLKQRLAAPSDVIDLGGVSELVGIRRDGGKLVVGALTAHGQVAASSEVRESIPALATLAGGIGDPQVRNRGTIGGSIANADPAADYPAAVLGLDATIT